MKDEIVIIDPHLTFGNDMNPLEKVGKLVIHHSEEKDWTVHQVHDFHQNVRGWEGIGYHYYIGGTGESDGTIYLGRKGVEGAHVYGHNDDTIGICLSGNFDETYPTENQMKAVSWLCRKLMNEYLLNHQDILGHRELGSTKTCPGKNFSMDQFRSLLEHSSKQR